MKLNLIRYAVTQNMPKNYSPIIHVGLIKNKSTKKRTGKNYFYQDTFFIMDLMLNYYYQFSKALVLRYDLLNLHTFENDYVKNFLQNRHECRDS